MGKVEQAPEAQAQVPACRHDAEDEGQDQQVAQVVRLDHQRQKHQRGKDDQSRVRPQSCGTADRNAS